MDVTETISPGFSWIACSLSNNEQLLNVALQYDIWFLIAIAAASFPSCEVDVNGKNTAPIYKFLKAAKGGFFGDGIKWNFSKFLVDKEGNVVDRYASTNSPLSIEKDIKKLLGIA